MKRTTKVKCPGHGFGFRIIFVILFYFSFLGPRPLITYHCVGGHCFCFPVLFALSPLSRSLSGCVCLFVCCKWSSSVFYLLFFLSALCLCFCLALFVHVVMSAQLLVCISLWPACSPSISPSLITYLYTVLFLQALSRPRWRQTVWRVGVRVHVSCGYTSMCVYRVYNAHNTSKYYLKVVYLKSLECCFFQSIH